MRAELPSKALKGPQNLWLCRTCETRLLNRCCALQQDSESDDPSFYTWKSGLRPCLCAPYALSELSSYPLTSRCATAMSLPLGSLPSTNVDIWKVQRGSGFRISSVSMASADGYANARCARSFYGDHLCDGAERRKGWRIRSPHRLVKRRHNVGRERRETDRRRLDGSGGSNCQKLCTSSIALSALNTTLDSNRGSLPTGHLQSSSCAAPESVRPDCPGKLGRIVQAGFFQSQSQPGNSSPGWRR